MKIKLQETKKPEARYLLSSDDSIRTVNNDDDRWIIEGWASTPSLDAYETIIDPSAFNEGLGRFSNNPAMFFNHGWIWDLPPIGKWLSWRIDSEQGFYVRGELSKTVPDLWTLVKEGNLKGLSIGFNVPEGGYVFDKEQNYNRIVAIELYEVSLVGLPANPSTLVEPARSAYMAVRKLYPENINTLTHKETIVMGNEKETREQSVLDPKEVLKRLDATQSENLKALQAVGEAMKTIALSNEGRETKLLELYEKSKAEMEGKMKALQDEVNKMHREVDVSKRPGNYDTGDEGGHYSYKKPTLRMILNTPPDKTYKHGLTEDHCRAIHEANDHLIILQQIRKLHEMDGNLFTGNRNDRYTVKNIIEKVIDSKKQELMGMTRAMDTGTAGEGAEWIPTQFSAEMIQRIELDLQVANQFRTLPMTSNPMKVRGKGANATAYLIAEPTTDTAAKIPASTPGSRVVTYDAPTIGVRIIESMELDEDSLINMVQEIQIDSVMAIRRGLDDGVMNGDKTALHMDDTATPYSFVPANDVKRFCYGLRYQAITGQSGTTYNTQTALAPNTAAWEDHDLTKIRELMPVFGINPADLVHFAGSSSYYKTKAFSIFSTLDKAGAFATWLRGYIQSVDGSPYIITEFIRNDYASTGKYTDGTGATTLHLIANKMAFRNGDMRKITADVIRDPETQQYRFVTTIRRDFQKEYASTDKVCAVGINIAV